MKPIIACMFILLTSFTATAQERSGFYMSVGGSLPEFDNGTTTINPINVYVRVGHDFNKYIGIGLEGNFSLIEDGILSGISFGINSYFAYLKGGIPIGENTRIYAMVGPSNVEITGNAFFILSATEEYNDIATGIGFEYSFGPKNSFTADYINYYDKGGVDVSAFNLGYIGYF